MRGRKKNVLLQYTRSKTWQGGQNACFVLPNSVKRFVCLAPPCQAGGLPGPGCGCSIAKGYGNGRGGEAGTGGTLPTGGGTGGGCGGDGAWLVAAEIWGLRV